MSDVSGESVRIDTTRAALRELFVSEDEPELVAQPELVFSAFCSVLVVIDATLNPKGIEVLVFEAVFSPDIDLKVEMNFVPGRILVGVWSGCRCLIIAPGEAGIASVADEFSMFDQLRLSKLEA